MLVKIANRKDPDQTVLPQKQSDLGLCCLSRRFWQATSVFEILEYLLIKKIDST